jgi:hypothetical protein
VGSYFSFYFKKKRTKRKGNFLSIAPLTKNSSTLLSIGYWHLPGAGFLPVQYCYLAFCHGFGFGVYNLSARLSSSAPKGTIKGWAFLYLSAGIMWSNLVILGLLFISCFAGFLPVVSWVLALKWLIINGIHFCMLYVFSGWGL